MAPEYALRRQLTRKADIYSFGVLLLEIVCGRCNKNERSPTEDETLLGKVITTCSFDFPFKYSTCKITQTFLQAWELYNKGELLELIDASLARDTNMDEAVKYVKICFVCTQEMPKLRPLMSTVVKMLTGEIEVQGKLIAKPGILPEAFLRRNIITGDASSPGYSSIEASPMRESTFISHGTMTFSSIYNRNS